ncbi:hypothetical protein [Hyalangium rubrum]|uniref:Uncharacterized protein n=1 Tax=Hyalangium rubrum TaxID=3103134 RepID=A0ABU5GWZ5_9BACT|nr:hypothetical protein [Hyalangium sp. s54d21]MDY7225556.1 hypothetical protein [Hyalangium sp. s54d21]
MTPWLTLSLGLWLGQSPGVTPSLPPDADTQDPAALELRDAWQRALDEAEATDEGQAQAADGVQMPVLELGTPDSPLSVPVSDGAAVSGAAQPEQPGIGGAGSDTGQEETATPAAPSPSGDMRGEMERLRTQVQSLRTQLEAQQAESAARTGLLQEQFSGMQERAQEQERLRTQRLDRLEDAGIWLLAADQALAVGELDVGDALDAADTALAEVLQNATEAGQGQTVQLIESARSRIAYALEAAGRRDSYFARGALYEAHLELRAARRHALDRQDTAVLPP